MVLSLYGGILILKTPDLQSHPFKAFAYMMLVDAANFWQFDAHMDIYRRNEVIDIPFIPILRAYVYMFLPSTNEQQFLFLQVLFCSNFWFQKIF